VGFIMEALDGRLLDRSVHSPDLAVGPRVSGLCQAMVVVVLSKCVFE